LLPASQPVASARPASERPADVSPQSRLVVTLLAYFLGYFGAHRFYLGKTGTGLAMLFTFGGLGVWYIVDFIFAVAGMMKDKDGKLIVDWQV